MKILALESHVAIEQTKGDSYASPTRTIDPTRAIDSARAAENIAEWRKYLPEDCVNSMVKAGWHGVV
jgi:hypothetical protein